MSSILFTDAGGTWKLHNGKPWPASRLSGFTPDSLPFGERAHRQSDGAMTMLRLRDDFSVTFELPMIPSVRSQNIALQPENFGATWSALGTPTRTPAADTGTGITLDLLGDDNAAATEGYLQTAVFTGDGVKAYSAYAKRGTAMSSVIALRDTTALVYRLIGGIAWAADGTPVLTTTFGTQLGYRRVSASVFRVLFAASSVIAANANQLQILPATTTALGGADTGDIYLGGIQVENNPTPTPYLHTTTVARSNVSLVEIADRLKYHLLNGGTCSVYTNDAAASSYATCGLKPGAVPQLTLADRRTMEYTLSLQLINLAGSPSRFLAAYAEQ